MTEWHRWLDALRTLDTLEVPRCFIRSCCDLVHRELHIFSDASAIAYGSVIYLRCIYADGSVSVSFVVGKCRLAPSKQVSIPRLELTAAVLSTRLYVQVTSAFKATLPVTFYTDSMVTLMYLRSETGRFPLFVANRVQAILDQSRASQWRYVPSELNPADEASRGVVPKKLLSSS